ncbi:MAG TPA: hypothetical protein VFB72_03245, partial [Verrucomicrobiae bacterium]|nr:hypothetical protein [Verrucomicrobiae bacterium]
PLFVSSESWATKSDGPLFDHVINTLKCQPSEMLHIGDNPHSDVARPREKGIVAHHWTPTKAQTPLVDQHTSISGAWEGDLASSLYTGLVRRRRLTHPVEVAGDKAFWEMIGYELMGPMHHAYVDWVIRRASRLGLKKLYFLARDGYNLLKTFDLFRKQSGVDMEGEYLFASRRLWNFARIDRLDEENMTFLISPNPMMRVRDFLSRIDIDPEPHTTLVRRFGFKGLNERITTEGAVFASKTYHENMRKLIRHFETQIIEHASREREALVNYFGDVGLLGEKVGIVDVGWGASSSRSLQMLLAQSGQHRRIPAFYFGTWSNAEWIIEAGCQFESLFMHLSQPLHRSWIVMESVELIESFFSAPHPTIIAIEKRDGRWNALHGEREMDAETERTLEIVTGAAFEFVRDALAIWPRSQELGPPLGYLETALERLLRHPTRDEAVAFSKFSWRNTFGGSGPIRHLANLPCCWSRIANPDALQDAYDHCYWKKGFLAQISPKAREYIKI